MGFKTNLIALSADVPRLSITTGSEAGRAAAEAAVAEIFPGRTLTFRETSNIYDASHPGDDTVGVSTYGDTIVLGGAWVLDTGRDEVLAATGGRQVWEVAIHSVVDLCHIEVRDAQGQIVRRLDRYVDMTPEEVGPNTLGEPLPFEAPYWAGQHADVYDETPGASDDDATPFHPLEMGEAAMGWIFGVYGEGAPTDEVQETLTVVDGFEVPMHVFAIGAAQKGLLGRLFGR